MKRPSPLKLEAPKAARAFIPSRVRKRHAVRSALQLWPVGRYLDEPVLVSDDDLQPAISLRSDSAQLAAEPAAAAGTS